MIRNKKLLVLIGGGVVLFMIIGLVIVRQRAANKGFQPEVSITTDPDTGEQIRTTNNAPESVGSDTFVTILGAPSVVPYMSSTQFSLFKDNLYVYLTARHGQDTLSIKILPETVVYDNSNEKQEFITGTFLIEKSSKRIGFRIDLIRSNGVDITYTDASNKQNPTYKSGPVVYNAEDEVFDGGDDLGGAPPTGP